MHVAFGIFAHNEMRDLPRLLDDLGSQDIFDASDIEAEVHLLANGCTDGTAEVARGHSVATRLGPRFVFHDLAAGGKSRTWNRFVHEAAPQDADFLGFLDADIHIAEPNHLSNLVRRLAAREDLLAFVSRPVADATGASTLISRAIIRGGGSAGDWQHAICGQCYLLRGQAARDMFLPIGLPVEDGFVSAMLRTDCMEDPGDKVTIDGDPELSHLFEPESTLHGYLRHQERIVVGSAINSALFATLRDATDGTRRQVLAEAAADPDWMRRELRRHLPARSFGWVPLHFLFKRVRFMLAKMHRPRDLLGIPRLMAYFGLDLLVYLRAQRRLARGIGTNYW